MRMLPTQIVLDEPAARRVLLAQAIDHVDGRGALLSDVEREFVEASALAATRDGQNPWPDPARYLPDRAARMLSLLEQRQPSLTRLQQSGPLRKALMWALPVLALLVGAALERVDNPRQVNMLSPPLLAFLFWNLAVYVLLGVLPFVRRKRGPRAPAAAGRWLMPQSWLHVGGRVATRAAARFHELWWRAANALERQRLHQVLHASAAAWAVGVALSIALGGLVREYRVGWESTLLELPQVHAFLSVLFAPVVALLPLEPFTAADLQRMHFDSGVAVAREEARRWVAMYLGLLLVVVIVPRAVLALVAWVRQRATGTVAIDLREPYFAEVMGRVSPARVAVAIEGDEAGRAILQQVLRGIAAAPESAGAALLQTPRGDELLLAQSPSQADLVLTASATADTLQLGVPSRYVPLHECTANWLREEPLRVAIGSALPAHQSAGTARLLEAWRERHEARFAESMQLLARTIAGAARDTQEVAGGAWSLRRLVSPAQREASQQARDEAMAALLRRVEEALVRSFATLQSLHGIDAPGTALQQQRVTDSRFVLRESVDAQQAGMAGAAAGVAAGALAGAKIDLLTGGLTLGAATALGALIGGTGAFTAARWNNRDAPHNGASVQLNDEMLQTLAELALLRYLAVAHHGRSAIDPSVWESEVVASVAADSEHYAAAWRDEEALAKALAATARKLLERLPTRSAPILYE